MLSLVLSGLASAERVGSFIVLGDWGYDESVHCDPSSGCGMSPQCQQNIGNLMKQWVEDNPDVKFVLNLGDSFYPAGVSSHSDSRWQTSWKDVYGSTITNLRWYSVYGNHDYEGRDHCACGDPATNPGLCAQLAHGLQPDTDGMDGWYMPNLYYHDTTYLEEFGIEIVAMDTNSVAESACKYLPSDCSQGSCWANLNARYSSSMDMFATRMKETQAENLLVFNHYPSYYYSGNRYSFIDALKTGAANDAQLYFFGGHTHFVQQGYGMDVSPAKQWLVGGGGGWGCDGAAQGFTVGIINKDAEGKFSIDMQAQLVNHASCCYHHMSLGEEEESTHWEDENDDAIYRTDEWWEGQLKMNGMWNQTCGGMECQSRRELLKKFRSKERLEGAAESTPTKEELKDEAERESGANFEFSQFFKETIEKIKQTKANRAAAKSRQVQVE